MAVLQCKAISTGSHVLQLCLPSHVACTTDCLWMRYLVEKPSVTVIVTSSHAFDPDLGIWLLVLADQTCSSPAVLQFYTLILCHQGCVHARH